MKNNQVNSNIVFKGHGEGRDDSGRSRNTVVHGEPSLHSGSCEESQEQNDRNGTRVLGAILGDGLKIPENRHLILKCNPLVKCFLYLL